MALTNDATNFVLQAIKGLMASPNQCFTAYDVTKAARSLTDERIDHNDVREVIHALYEQGFLAGYNRVTHMLPSRTGGRHDVPAQLFVPPGGSAFMYDPDQVVMTKLDQKCDDCECEEDSDSDDSDVDFDDFDDDSDDAGKIIPVARQDFSKFFPPGIGGATSILGVDKPASPVTNFGLTGLGTVSPANPTPNQVTVPPLPSAPASNKTPATQEQQETYLKGWNKNYQGEEPGLLQSIRDRLSQKIKNFLS